MLAWPIVPRTACSRPAQQHCAAESTESVHRMSVFSSCFSIGLEFLQHVLFSLVYYYIPSLLPCANKNHRRLLIYDKTIIHY